MNPALKFLVFLLLILTAENVYAAEKKDPKGAKPKFDSSSIWGVRRGPNYKPPAETPKTPAVDSSEADSMNKYYEDQVRNGSLGGNTGSGGQSAAALSPEQCAIKKQ